MPPRREPEQTDEHAVLIAIVLLLLAGLALSALARRLTILLAPLGIPATAVISLLALLGESGVRPVPPTAATPAMAAMQRGYIARRAMYMLAAVRRLARGGTVDAERRLYRAHLAAERRRAEAAEAVDAAAKRYGPILGWWAKRDDRTTPACRAAHGANFSALTPPAIGWPGTIHAGECRCEPTAPWPQGDFLEGTPAAVEDRLLRPLER